MLLMLKIHVSLQRETNACGQRNKRMYSAPTKKSCLSEKQSTGRDLFWANLLRLICKVLAHAKKSSQATLQFVIWPQRSPSSIDGPNWRILCQAVPKLKNTFFFLKIHLPLQKEAVFSSTNKKIFRLMHMICCTRGNKHGMFNVTNKQTKVTYKGRGYFSQLF